MEIHRPIGQYIATRRGLALCAGLYQRLTQFVPFMKLGKVESFYTIDQGQTSGADIIGSITQPEVINYLPDNYFDVITLNNCGFQTIMNMDEMKLNLGFFATYSMKLRENGVIIINNLILAMLQEYPGNITTLWKDFRVELGEYSKENSYKKEIIATEKYQILTAFEAFINKLRAIGMKRFSNILIDQTWIYTILYF